MTPKQPPALICDVCGKEMLRKLCKNGATHYTCFGRDPLAHRLIAFRTVEGEKLTEETPGPVPPGLASRLKGLLDRADKLNEEGV